MIIWGSFNSLLNCKSAKAGNAIRKGLNLPNIEVQKAAALNTGSFNDPIFLLYFHYQTQHSNTFELKRRVKWSKRN